VPWKQQVFLTFSFSVGSPDNKNAMEVNNRNRQGFKWITKRTKRENSTPTIAVETAVKQNSLYVLLSAHMWYLMGLPINIKRINNRVRWPSVSYVKEEIFSQQKV
jgi:hypothetical protein